MTVPPHLIQMIRDRLEAGQVLIPRHLVSRSQSRTLPVDAIEQVVRRGIVVEWYPDRDRLLLQERVRIAGRLHWLHVVVSYAGRTSIAIVTAYEPDPAEWGDPPTRRV
jgi:hypothetical protein